jgi:hypothetical protein
MVNTFLVHSNYLKSAKMLDNKRLPNQRREAFQILNNIQRLKAMGEFVDNVLPKDPYIWYDWIRIVIKMYKIKSVKMSGNLYKINGAWEFVEKIIPLNFELEIRYGYIYHPAVLMWLGWEASLKEYLNAHIEISISRGVQNNMKLYDLKLEKNPIDRPPWTKDKDFFKRHRSMLINKEIDRSEVEWYQLKKRFIKVDRDLKYFWPYAKTIGKGAAKTGEADLTKRYK